MQKVFSVDKIRLADQFTIENEPIKSIDLMERAATACVKWIHAKLLGKNSFNIFCGPGNNGGDGLAIARLLAEQKQKVSVFILASEHYSTEFQINLERLGILKKVSVQRITSESEFPVLVSDQILIDALFGSGLKRPLHGLVAQLVNHLNNTGCLKLAIDIPSGLFSDKSTKGYERFQADYTLSFQFPKLAFFMPENDPFVGEWQILDIGLNQNYIQKADTSFYFLESRSMAEWIRPRTKFAHKGSYGHGLLIAGSQGKMGAALLAGKAALRSGAGLITVHIPKSGMSIIPCAVPELMASLDEHESFFSKIPNLSNYSAIAIGPGLGSAKQTQSAVKLIIQESKIPIIVDADALNILSENKTWLHFLPSNSIFTPHVKEFERLAGKAENDFDRLDKQMAFSKKYQIFVILKGAHTSISTPDGKVFFNSTGNPGMATGGSGDVLTGILLGLRAQNYSALQTCLLGVFLHGLAGDFAAENKGQASLIASDIVESMPAAFFSLSNI